MTARQFLLAAVAVALVTPFSSAADLPPAFQRDQEKKVRAEVERTALEMETALRVLMYQRVAADDEQKTLSDVAAQLRGLGDDQIRAVLKHLDAAVTAPDEATASTEQKAAYVKHRQVVVAEDARRSSTRSSRRSITRPSGTIGLQKEEYDLALKRSRRSRRSITRSAVAGGPTPATNRPLQTDLRTELVALTKLVAGMKSTLTPDQRPGWNEPTRSARANSSPPRCNWPPKTPRAVPRLGDRDRKISKDLQALAAALRTPREKIAALKEARATRSKSSSRNKRR